MALLFGALSLASLMPLRWDNPWLWLVFISSAILFIIAISGVQMPLQVIVSNLLLNGFGKETYRRLLLLMAIPPTLLSGIIQEAAKLVPVLAYWWGHGSKGDARLGLSVGAFSGAGFGVFEAQWFLNAIFATGFSQGLISVPGVFALAGIWERFFAVAFHIGSTALVGWGLGRGKTWQMYLVAALWHSLLNYNVVLYQTGVLGLLTVELIIAVEAALLFRLVLWLRYGKVKIEPPQVESPVDSEPKNNV